MTAQRAEAGAGVNDFWHYAVGSEKRGPVPRTTVAKLLASGEISSETYVWQPGMDNWVHLGDAPTLKALVAALDGDGQPEEFVEEDTTFTSSAEVKAVHEALDDADEDLSSDTIVESIDDVTRGVAALTQSQSESATTLTPMVHFPEPAKAEPVKAAPVAAAQPAKAAAQAQPAQAQPQADDLFGGSDDLFGAGPESQDEGPVGVHARRQSSVLFKLDELGRDESQKGGENQQFLTDSSGLIDIRAIASADKKTTAGDDPFGAPFPSSGANLNLGPRTLMTPLSMPIVGRRRSIGPWILAAVALLVAGGVALAVILSGDKPVENQTAKAPDQVATAPTEPAKPAEVKPAEVKPTEAKPAEVKPAEAAPTEAKPAEAVPTEAKPAEAQPTEAKPGEVQPTEAKPAEVAKVETKPADKPKAAADKPKTTPTEDKPKTTTEDKPKVEVVAAPKEPANNPNNTNKVNDLLNKLNQGEKTTTTQTDTTKDDSLPDKLSAASVRNAIKGRFSRCGGMIANPTGSVTVQTQFVISSSGVVQSANVTDGGGTSAEVQRCVVGVIKETTFGHFKEPTMQVNLPVRLL